VLAAVFILAIAGWLASVHLSSTSKIWHPIDKLIKEADIHFSELLVGGEPQTVAQAAEAYRMRRGRHPPPFFDKWFEWAQEHNCMIHEFMFDQVHEDIEPFWGADAARMRADAASWPVILTVRDGVAERRRMTPTFWDSWDMVWLRMMKEIPSAYLPDVDMALNEDDR
jgi:hypothetical protein